jgi:two-component system response regulator HydG
MESIRTDGQIILLDLKLQNTDCLTLLEEIRYTYPQVPVVLITGYREEMASVIQRAMKICACPCLYKPLEIEELLRLLNGLRLGELGRILGNRA